MKRILLFRFTFLESYLACRLPVYSIPGSKLAADFLITSPDGGVSVRVDMENIRGNLVVRWGELIFTLTAEHDMYLLLLNIDSGLVLHGELEKMLGLDRKTLRLSGRSQHTIEVTGYARDEIE